jgi:multiple sugar transport system ATP-binding protein
VGGLALSGVSKRFGDTLVLDDISLTIGADEFVVVLGPSGCGKSTLLRAVAGLESIDAGEIALDGQRIDRLPPGRRGVAMVFQTYALYPHMTVRENMAFGLRNAGVEREEIARRIADAARILEMEHLLERRPAELSGGQRQRVAIGRAIVKEPKLFMFDEPLSNLDAALRGRTRQEIANLHRRVKTAMIFVTHDQTEAMSLADRIVVMNARRIEQIGTPLEIYSRPATAFVAGFVGAPAMNFFVAERVASDDGFQRVRLGDGTVIQTRIPVAALPKDGALRVGLRAEAIQLCAPGSGDANGAVDFVEFLGDKTHVYLTLASGDKIVTVDGAPSQARAGGTIGVRFSGAAAHLFDAEDRGYHGAA